MHDVKECEGYVIVRAEERLVDAFVDYRAKVAIENHSLEYGVRKQPAVDFIDSYSKPTRLGYFVMKNEDIVGELFVTSVEYTACPVIVQLYVMKSERTQGVGKLLLDTLHAELLSRKCKIVSIHQHAPATEFFNKHGYTKPPKDIVNSFLFKELAVKN